MHEPAEAYVEVGGSLGHGTAANNRFTISSTRTRLVESTVGVVEDVRCPGMHVRRSPEDFSPSFQVCLPYRGLFVWHVGNDEVVADPNQVLFVSGGESFHLSQPVCTDYAELIVTPDPGVLAELANTTEARLSLHPLFRRRSRRSDVGLQLLRARFFQTVMCSDFENFAAEELLLGILRLALDADIGPWRASPRTCRLIARAKEFLEAHLADPIRLADVAHAVGASPAYLTDVFSRIEGVPLHRYLTQLRLARALVELPDAHDITTLALDLGFSSHSHFTVVFRRAFGCAPSEFRKQARNGRRSAALTRLRMV
jgi:AraC-like DNA-binding protein